MRLIHDTADGFILTEDVTLYGVMSGETRVPATQHFWLYGTLDGDLHIEQHGIAAIFGIVSGSVHNAGQVTVHGMVQGRVHTAPNAQTNLVRGSWVGGQQTP